MNLTLLYFDGCPHWEQADALLRTIVGERPDIVVDRRLVETVEDAEAVSFRGSPSFVIDGHDLFAEPAADDGAGESFGLSCRRYVTPTGPAGTPTLEQLREAIARV